ncbi:hypothetical protein [Andreprevotia lacus]|nr:hypothetical protein [Andreprevotia lacus]
MAALADTYFGQELLRQRTKLDDIVGDSKPVIEVTTKTVKFIWLAGVAVNTTKGWGLYELGLNLHPGH